MGATQTFGDEDKSPLVKEDADLRLTDSERDASFVRAFT